MMHDNFDGTRYWLYKQLDVVEELEIVQVRERIQRVKISRRRRNAGMKITLTKEFENDKRSKSDPPKEKKYESNIL
jgi:hypothetical protein